MTHGGEPTYELERCDRRCLLIDYYDGRVANWEARSGMYRVSIGSGSAAPATMQHSTIQAFHHSTFPAYLTETRLEARLKMIKWRYIDIW